MRLTCPARLSVLNFWVSYKHLKIGKCHISNKAGLLLSKNSEKSGDIEWAILGGKNSRLELTKTPHHTSPSWMNTCSPVSHNPDPVAVFTQLLGYLCRNWVHGLEGLGHPEWGKKAHCRGLEKRGPSCLWSGAAGTSVGEALPPG